MLLKLASWLGKYGTALGLLIIASPFVYDVVGVLYGRDYHIKIELLGGVVQLVGIGIILVVIAIRKWAGDERVI